MVAWLWRDIWRVSYRGPCPESLSHTILRHYLLGSGTPILTVPARGSALTLSSKYWQHHPANLESIRKDYWLLLGTALPGFRSFNPLWPRLSKRSWDPKPLRRYSLSPWQEHHLCPLLLHPAWPQADDCLTKDGSDSSREGRPKTGTVTMGPLGKDLGDYRKRG